MKIKAIPLTSTGSIFSINFIALCSVHGIVQYCECFLIFKNKSPVIVE